MNPIARALASEPFDSPRKAALFELLPLGSFLVLAVSAVLAWLVLGWTDLMAGVVFLLGLLLSPLIVLSGFGWMGRGHKWVAGVVLLTRAALSFVVLMEFNPDGPIRSREEILVAWLFLAGWIAMPVVSACLVALVPAGESGLAHVVKH